MSRISKAGNLTFDATALTVAWLHDPPDKSLDIQGHEARAVQYLGVATGEPSSGSAIHSESAFSDQQAAIAERLPMPTAGRNGERAVGPDSNGRLLITHPLSGAERHLPTSGVQADAVEAVIKSVVEPHKDARIRFLALWRRLPDALAAKFGATYRFLPADPRVPDHTIWHHADMMAGVRAASEGMGGLALLGLEIGPVQTFIAAGRSLRDLWTGSTILSWLAFQAMEPVLAALGPTAFIHPALRGNPLCDRWLRGLGIDLPATEPAASPVVGLPNRFLALVPWGQAEALARACEQAAQAAWSGLAEQVRTSLAKKFPEEWNDWDRLWSDQIRAALHASTTVLPLGEASEAIMAGLVGAKSFAEAFPEAAAVRSLGAAIPSADLPTYRQDQAGTWQAWVDLSARLGEAARMVRPVPTVRAEGRVPGKCSLLGTWEQMGPADLDDSTRFWEHARTLSLGGSRIRKGERFCAISLVKRFAPACGFGDELGGSTPGPRFPDTATLAAAEWLDATGLELPESWSGQWLHWTHPREDPEDECPPETWKRIQGAKQRARDEDLGAPPTYYAVLMMDGDRLGRWLRGENSLPVGTVLHPRLRQYFEGLGSTTRSGLEAPRPVGPALHAAISEALGNYATRVVPEIVNRYRGALIYAGGDDVLALLPSRVALRCAAELQKAYRGCPDANGGRECPGANGGAPEGWMRQGEREWLTMGPKATVSAGLAVVHFREDLRAALDAARSAEQRAKSGGRDRLELAVRKRAGERSTVPLAWSMLAWVDDLVTAFAGGASDRWTYRLRQAATTLSTPHLPAEAAIAELRRQISRADTATQEALAGPDGTPAADRRLADLMRAYSDWAGFDGAEGLSAFLSLCQSAAFIARGRSE